MIETIPTPGDILIYHGSIVDYHGPARFERVCGYCRRCAGGDDRFRLTHLVSGEELSCVSRKSVSFPVDEAETPMVVIE